MGVVVFGVVCIVLIVCITKYNIESNHNHRKEEAFWGRDKNEVDLNPILDELNDLKCAIHRQAGQIKELNNGIQKNHERLNNLEYGKVNNSEIRN